MSSEILEKSRELVQEHDRHADAKEFEDFENRLHFLHACIIPGVGKVVQWKLGFFSELVRNSSPRSLDSGRR